MESFGLFNFLKSALFPGPAAPSGEGRDEGEADATESPDSGAPTIPAPRVRDEAPVNPCLELLERHERLSRSIDKRPRR